MPLPTSCDGGEKVLRKIILNASKHHIPQGKRTNYSPDLTPDTITLMNLRDQTRTSNPAVPNIEVLDRQITSYIDNNKRSIWREKLQSCSFKNHPSKYFKLIKSLSGKNPTQYPNQPITFNNKILTDHKDISKAFCKQFTSSTIHTQTIETCRTIRKIRKKLLNNNAASFTPHLLTHFLKLSGNSTTAGPDGITILHLKDLLHVCDGRRCDSRRTIGGLLGKISFSSKLLHSRKN